MGADRETIEKHRSSIGIIVDHEERGAGQPLDDLG